MALTAEIGGYFITPGSNQGMSAQLQDYTIYNPAGMPGCLQDYVIYNPAGMSAQLQDQAGEPVVIQGIDLVTGQFKNVSPGDTVTRSNSSVYDSTGIYGLTGLLGVTGSAPMGATGLLGTTGTSSTGISGFTGYVGIQGIIGATGIQGVTGTIGSTGFIGITGIDGEEGFRFLGDTGIQGFTGLLGITGLTLSGVTGLSGETGLLGTTGIAGFTGISPNNQGLSGEVGLIGTTGTYGLTGLVVRGEAGPLLTLSAQNPVLVSNTASFNIAASTLATNNQYLQFVMWGALNSNTANTITLSFGSATLLGTSVYMDSQASGFGNFYLTGTILRTGSTSQECITDLLVPNTTRVAVRNSTAVSLSTANTLSLTLDSSAVIRGFIIRKGLQV